MTRPPTMSVTPSGRKASSTAFTITAGAPIDKGAGISIFKKIGDRVEKGETGLATSVAAWEQFHSLEYLPPQVAQRIVTDLRKAMASE